MINLEKFAISTKHLYTVDEVAHHDPVDNKKDVIAVSVGKYNGTKDTRKMKLFFECATLSAKITVGTKFMLVDFGEDGINPSYQQSTATGKWYENFCLTNPEIKVIAE